MNIISSYMEFDTFKEFYSKCNIIKYSFNRLSFESKYIYKLYVYSKRHEKEYKLDKIWEFLNEPVDSDFYVTCDMLKHYL